MRGCGESEGRLACTVDEADKRLPELLRALHEQGVVPSEDTWLFEGGGLFSYPDFWDNVREGGAYGIYFDLYHTDMALSDFGSAVREEYLQRHDGTPSRLVFQAADARYRAVETGCHAGLMPVDRGEDGAGQRGDRQGHADRHDKDRREGMGPIGLVRGNPGAEQQASAAIVGVDVVEFLDHADGVLVYGPELRRDFAAAIRRHRPETVVTINHRETWGEAGALNSADHRVVGSAVLDAVADAGNRWIFRGVGGKAHQARRVMVAGSPRARHAIDVSDTVDLAIASLAEHKTYLEGLGEHPMADPEFLRWVLADVGARAGCDAALGIELFDF